MVEIIKKAGDYLGIVKKYKEDEPVERRWFNQRGKAYIKYQIASALTIIGATSVLDTYGAETGLLFLSVPVSYMLAKSRVEELVKTE